MAPPAVTGISPKEGPPGTRVTIRGEKLGNKPQDLISKILAHLQLFLRYSKNLCEKTCLIMLTKLGLVCFYYRKMVCRLYLIDP